MPPKRSLRPISTEPIDPTSVEGKLDYLTWCNASKANRTPCDRRVAKNVRPGFAPVCKIHVKLRLPEGICQGLERCGQPCGLQFVQQTGEYPLCSLHKGQYRLMPCHLLELPVELRMEILRHVAPQSYSDRSPRKRELKKQYRSIMRIHPTISREANSIFYQETPFEICVMHDCVRMCGAVWRPTYLTRSMQDLVDALSSIPVNLMRNFNVSIRVRTKSLASHWQDATDEGTISDRCREMCHVVTEFLASIPKIRKLEISLHLTDNFEPHQTPMVAPYIISPFLRLRNIRQPVLHAMTVGWSYTEIGTVQETSNTPMGQPNPSGTPIVDPNFSKLQSDFASLLQRDEPLPSKPSSWVQYEALLNVLGAMSTLLELRHCEDLILQRIHRTACLARDMNDSYTLTRICISLQDTFKVQRDYEEKRWKRFKSTVNECIGSSPPGTSFELRFRDARKEVRPGIRFSPLGYQSIFVEKVHIENYWITSDGLVLLKYHEEFAQFHEHGYRLAPCTVTIALELAKHFGRKSVSTKMRLDAENQVVCVDNGIRFLVEFPPLTTLNVANRPEV